MSVTIYVETVLVGLGITQDELAALASYGITCDMLAPIIDPTVPPRQRDLVRRELIDQVEQLQVRISQRLQQLNHVQSDWQNPSDREVEEFERYEMEREIAFNTRVDEAGLAEDWLARRRLVPRAVNVGQPLTGALTFPSLI